MTPRTALTGHVFISYAREDQTYVHKLAENLHKRGFETWIDDRIDFGDRWWQTIVQSIRDCAALVVVMTPRAEKSEWVEREILLALEEGKPIFPLLLRGQRFPLLITTQYVDVTNGQTPPEGFYKRLERVAPSKPKVERRPPTRQPFEPEMILIPAGEFLMGSDPNKDKDAHEDEQPQHTLYLPDYSIAKTPVTNAQYAAFVKATGRKPPGPWEGGEPLERKEDHPVVNVSWREAMAYCDWLAEKTGKPYRLPTEAEWEKAARGTDGRIYPWGDEWDAGRCNTGESGKLETTPVAAYPQGASPYGLLDMAGNVWEWCRSLKKPYPYDPKDGREDLSAEGSRALRGGSWGYGRWDVRVSYRSGYHPGYFGSLLGFRVDVAPV